MGCGLLIGKSAGYFVLFGLLLFCTSCRAEMGGVLPVDTAPTHKEEYITKQSRNVWFSPLLQDSTLEEILLFPGVELKNETSESLGNITLNRTRYTLFKAADNVPPAVDLKLQYPRHGG